MSHWIRHIVFAAWAAVVSFSGQAAAQEEPSAGSPPAHEAATRDQDYLVDVNVGAARANVDSYRFAGDAQLGYWTRSLGLVATGSTEAFDEQIGPANIDTTQWQVAGEAWYLTGDQGGRVRLELRASGGGAFYDSTYVPLTTGAAPFSDQNSVMGRGGLLVGLRWRPSARFAMEAVVGGGMQFEWYDYSTVAAGSGWQDRDDQTLSARGEGRLHARWVAVPDIVSFRVRVLASYFRLTRDAQFLSTAGGVSLQATQEQLSQLEMTNRLFMDIDAAEVVGFYPTVHAGADYFRLSGNQGELHKLVPMLGAGIVRPWL
ncbi:MAG: hypothetical protein MUF54_08115 [Polyangiaceae bacterium]|jgi:hypothetical protein|nr:hypothetical protein [Polyangiaceae bacterium]